MMASLDERIKNRSKLEYKTISTYLEQFKGGSFNAKDRSQVVRFLFERKYDVAAKMLRFGAPIGELSPGKICIVTVKDKEGSLLDIGGSTPFNLFMNNYGSWHSGAFIAPTVGEETRAVTDTVPMAESVKTYGLAAGDLYNAFIAGTGVDTQVGAGSTAPARDDDNIETVFGTAPESGRFDITDGSYAAGIITFSGSIAAGAAGTIREICLFAHWIEASAGVLKNILLARDAPTAVSFVFTNTIAVAYSIAV